MFYIRGPSRASFLKTIFLDHTLDKLVDLLSTVSGLSSLKEVNKLGLVGESSTGGCELERPQEVVGLLEVRSNSGKLVDEVSTALDSDGSNTLLNDRVVSDRDALLVELGESTLEDKLFDSGTGGVSVGDVRLNKTEHANGRLVQLNEGSVVDLTKTEELHDLLGLGGDTDGTSDTDDQGNLGHGRDEESTSSLGLTAVGDSGLIGGLVLSGVLFSGSNGVLLVLTLLLLGIVRGLLGLISELALCGLLLEDGFGDLGCHDDEFGLVIQVKECDALVDVAVHVHRTGRRAFGMKRKACGVELHVGLYYFLQRCKLTSLLSALSTAPYPVIVPPYVSECARCPPG